MAAAENSSPAEKSSKSSEDYAYILNIIQHLQDRWRIFIFISTKDFDVLYRWWEKRIPLHVVHDAIDRVVTRWNKRGKNIKSYSNFGYEVKKMFQSFLELHVQLVEQEESAVQYAELDDFIAAFPLPLNPLRELFQQIVGQIKAGGVVDLHQWHRRLLEQFASDNDLEIKVKLFLRNLAPELRNEEIAAQYRLNYLANRFGIPDIEFFTTE